MWIEKTIGFLKGYIVFSAEGVFCERFLNVCMHRGIYLWDVRRMGSRKITASVSIKGFHKFREIARKTRTHISVTRRCGFPFLLHRYRKRKPVFAGIGLFLIVLWYLTTHIMGIDIIGNERISTWQIMDQLKNFGVHYGAAVRKVDSKLVKNQLMTSLDDAAWIGVNIKGSRVYIEVKERLDTKVELDRDVPCDIVASKGGVIRLLEVKNGQTVVKVGEYVEEGDLLVSGVVDSQRKGMRYVHSFGEVYAETLYKKSRKIPLDYTEKIYTEKEKARYSLQFFGKRINLFLKSGQPFEYCDRKEEKKEYGSKLSFVPKLEVRKETFREYTPQSRRRTEAEAIRLGAEELSSVLDREIPAGAEVIDKKVTYTKENENGVAVTVEYLVREDIAQQRKIDKTEILDYDVE